MVRVVKLGWRVATIRKMYTAFCDGGKMSEKLSSNTEMEIGE
jgi:hypothetical protein